MATVKLSKRIKGKIRGKSKTFHGDIFLIGTGPDCEIQIDSEFVSEVHTLIRHVPNQGFFLEDQDNLTGTYLNARPVEEQTRINSGDKIMVGELVYTAEIDDPENLHIILETRQKRKIFSLELEEFPEDRKWKYFLIGLSLVVGVLFPLFVFPQFVSQEEYLSVGPIHEMHLDEKGRPLDCSQCHTPFRGVSRQKCGECHEKTVKTDVHHTLENNCKDCHKEHGGRQGQLTVNYSPQSCRTCHQKAHKESGPSLVDQPRRDKTFIFNYPGFSHQEHLAEKLECNDCHKRSPHPWEDFKRPDYQVCIDCHTHKDLQVNLHGKDACLKCHRNTKTGQYKVVEHREAFLSSFEMKKVSHPLKEKSCRKCHRGPKSELVTTRSGERFPHEDHLRIAPENVDQCLQCHKLGKRGNMTRGIQKSDDCQKCHQGKVNLKISYRSRRSLDFPHGPHIAYFTGKKNPENKGGREIRKKGCLACHKPDKKGHFSFLPTQKICTDCHEGHQNLKVDRCRKCHKSGGMNDVFKNPPLVSQNLQSMIRFSHKTKSHRKMDCTRCHLDMEGAQTLKEVNFPRPKDKICARCHIPPGGSDREEKSKGLAKMEDCLKCHRYHEK